MVNEKRVGWSMGYGEIEEKERGLYTVMRLYTCKYLDNRQILNFVLEHFAN